MAWTLRGEARAARAQLEAQTRKTEAWEREHSKRPDVRTRENICRANGHERRPDCYGTDY